MTTKGAIALSSAGNDGRKTNVYPALYATVIGVASTTEWDTLSTFRIRHERGVDCGSR